MTALHTLDGVQVDAVPPELAIYPFGVFTTFVLVDGTVLDWPEHAARLARDAYLLWGHTVDTERLAHDVRLHSRLLGQPAAARVTLYPNSMRLAVPSEARGCRTLVSSRPAQFPFVPGRGLAVRTIEHQRELPEMKSTDIFSQLRHRREAQLAGCDDALFVKSSYVLEGSTWTVLSWQDDVVSTPSGPVLPSITALGVTAIAKDLGWRFEQRPIGLSELMEADLVVAANAVSPARPIRRIDVASIAVDQDLLAQLASAFSQRHRHRV